MNNDTLINFGGAVKAIKTEGDLVTVGGYLVTFGDQSTKDGDGDWFTGKTYYGAHQGDGVDVCFHHGLPFPIKSTDPVMAAKVAKMSDQIFGTVKTKVDETGIFAETILNMADSYQKVLADMSIAGKLGWSSGSVAHQVRYKDGAKSGEIERWLIAEASLTPTPCDPRNVGTVLPLKAYIEQEQAEETKGIKSQYFGDYAEAEITASVIDALCWRLRYDSIYDAFSDVQDGEMDWAAARARLSGSLDEFKDLVLRVADAVMSGGSEQTPEMAVKFLHAKKSNDGESLFSGLPNAEFRQALVSGAKSYPALQMGLKAKREAENRNFLTEQKKTELESVSVALKAAAAEVDGIFTPAEVVTTEAVGLFIPDFQSLTRITRLQLQAALEN